MKEDDFRFLAQIWDRIEKEKLKEDDIEAIFKLIESFEHEMTGEQRVVIEDIFPGYIKYLERRKEKLNQIRLEENIHQMYSTDSF